MKQMIILLLAIFSVAQVNAEGIHFTKNKTWKELVAQAKKENKLIFLDAYATWCGPCKYMQSSVFPDASVGAYFNKNFINVKMDMEEGEGPQLAEDFGLTAYPTLYFVNGDGKLVHKSVGGIGVKDLLILGKNALLSSKQFYTVKEKIKTGTLAPAAVLEWLVAAEKMDEPKLNDLLYDYLTKTRFGLDSKEMLGVMLDHAKRLPETAIRFLYDNKTKLLPLTGKTEEEYNDLVKDKIVNHAYLLALKNTDLDFELFQKTITPFKLLNPALETQIMKVRFYTTIADSAQAVGELGKLLKSYAPLLDPYSMVSLVYDAAPLIAASKQATELLTLVDTYKLPASKTGEEYYKQLALLSIYYYQTNSEKINEYADKILANADAPAYIRRIAEKMKEN